MLSKHPQRCSAVFKSISEVQMRIESTKPYMFRITMNILR
ncbi:unnamed protein product, partial [Arabidopsis halleri]